MDYKIIILYIYIYIYRMNPIIVNMIIIILCFIIYHKLFRKKKILRGKKILRENMSNVKLTPKLKQKIKDFISTVYQADIESIRNLAAVATKLQKHGLTIPGNLKVTGNIQVNGKFNYLPRGVIMAHNSPNAPPGWAICDGRNGTPDLRGRFIRMHTNGMKFNNLGNSYIGTNLKGSYSSRYGGLRWNDANVWRLRQNFGSYGGSDIIENDPEQMPKHKHNTSAAGSHIHGMPKNLGRGGNGPKQVAIWYGHGGLGWSTSPAGNHSHGVSYTGASKPINNQPSYYVLTWIMKL